MGLSLSVFTVYSMAADTIPPFALLILTSSHHRKSPA
eukprot:COSAG04_NODE_17008_length_482_cov_0.830287_1_plen_36_part_10